MYNGQCTWYIPTVYIVQYIVTLYIVQCYIARERSTYDTPDMSSNPVYWHARSTKYTHNLTSY